MGALYFSGVASRKRESHSLTFTLVLFEWCSSYDDFVHRDAQGPVAGHGDIRMNQLASLTIGTMAIAASTYQISLNLSSCSFCIARSGERYSGVPLEGRSVEYKRSMSVLCQLAPEAWHEVPRLCIVPGAVKRLTRTETSKMHAPGAPEPSSNGLRSQSRR